MFRALWAAGARLTASINRSADMFDAVNAEMEARMGLSHTPLALPAPAMPELPAPVEEERPRGRKSKVA